MLRELRFAIISDQFVSILVVGQHTIIFDILNILVNPKLGSVKSVFIKWDFPLLEEAVTRHLNDGFSQKISDLVG